MQCFESFKISKDFSQKLLFQHPSEPQDAAYEQFKTLLTSQSHQHCSKTVAMESRTRKPGPSTLGMAWRRSNATQAQASYRSFTTVASKKSVKGSYFGLESMFLLVCLTASLLILPVILPPLPPPPFLLLLLPICIFGLLMMLAFMPSNVRDLSCSKI